MEQIEIDFNLLFSFIKSSKKGVFKSYKSLKIIYYLGYNTCLWMA